MNAAKNDAEIANVPVESEERECPAALPPMGDIGCVVGGVVIADDDLVRHARLRMERCQGLIELSPTIVSDDADAQPRPAQNSLQPWRRKNRSADRM